MAAAAHALHLPQLSGCAPAKAWAGLAAQRRSQQQQHAALPFSARLHAKPSRSTLLQTTCKAGGGKSSKQQGGKPAQKGFKPPKEEPPRRSSAFGDVLPNNRIEVVDPESDRTIDCLIRRRVTSSSGDQCYLVQPLDMAVQILSQGKDGSMEDLDDDGIEPVLPVAAKALAELGFHLVHSAYALTIRGQVMFSEENMVEFDGADGEESAVEGVEICSFSYKNREHLVYAPLERLTFVAYQDKESGKCIFAPDEISEDPAIDEAIEEEERREEELALQESLK
eukprot:jgi/Chlat1/9165/Chrsp97S08400